MKSKVNKLVDYKSYLNDFKLDFKLDEAKLEDELNVIRVKNKREDAVEKIERDDIVSVNLKSDIKKYNIDNLKIVVGSNYFSKIIEESLVGLSLNDEKVVNVDGNNVIVKIIDIKRNSLPNLTNELIKQENIPNIETLDDYKKMFYEKSKKSYIENKLIEFSIMVYNELLEKSEFSLCDEDIKEMFAEMLNFYRNAALNEGKALEKMNSEELSKISNYSSYEELVEREKETSTTLVKICAISSIVLDKDISNMEANRNNVLKLQMEFTNYLRKQLGI